MASVGDAKNLAQLLKQRRLDLKGSNKEVTQPEIADAIRQSQAQVWKIEQGQVDILRWFPERQLALLRAYRYSDAEIEEISTRFNLGLTEYLNKLGTEPQNSAIVWFTDVLNAGAEERLPVPRAFLESKGVREEDCETLLISDNVLMPESLRPALPAGTFLVFSLKAELSPERYLIFEHPKLDRYVVLRPSDANKSVPVMAADGTSGVFVDSANGALKVLGIAIAVMNPLG